MRICAEDSGTPRCKKPLAQCDEELCPSGSVGRSLSSRFGVPTILVSFPRIGRRWANGESTTSRPIFIFELLTSYECGFETTSSTAAQFADQMPLGFPAYSDAAFLRPLRQIDDDLIAFGEQLTRLLYAGPVPNVIKFYGLLVVSHVKVVVNQTERLAVSGCDGCPCPRLLHCLIMFLA
jgi:hypothetical protein